MGNELSIFYLLDVAKRRYMFFIAPVVLILPAALIMITLLPPLYQSRGVILIESPQISNTIIAGSVSSGATERLEVIKQRVMTRANLIRIAREYGVFQGQAEIRSSTEIIDAMRELSNVTFISSGVGNRNTSTIAFNVIFNHRNPTIAAQVANQLVTLFLEENIRNRTQIATETTDFLNSEAEKLEKALLEIEGKIAEYKQSNASALPENLDIRLQQRERMENRILEIEREIKNYQEEGRFLEIQLNSAQSQYQILAAQSSPVLPTVSSSSPVAIEPEVQELIELRARLADASIVYSERHPDVRALQRQIELAQAKVERLGGVAAKQLRLAEIEQILGNVSLLEAESMSEAELRAERDSLTSELQETTETTAAVPELTDAFDKSVLDLNIANIRTKITVASERMDSLRLEQEKVRTSLAQVEQAILQTPQVDRILNGLARDYESAENKYNEVRAKAMQAQIAENVEESSKAERFVLIEPPIAPDEPISPNRPKLMMLSFALAFGVGAAAVVGMEFIDGSIRGVNSVTVMTGLTPIGVIPYITTTNEVKVRKTRLYIAFVVMIALAAATIVAAHYLYMPIDLLLEKIIRRFQ